MKTHYSMKAGWRAIGVVAGCLTVLSQAANAQLVTSGTIRNGVIVSGSGPGTAFVQQTDGSGPQHGFVMVIGGPGEIGASLLKTCDANQDGAATLEEVAAALLAWFQKADTDTNGALSQVELATALKEVFPLPQPPPGLPAPPEEFGLHNVLAKKLMTTVDANKDGWITFKEAIGFLGQNFPQWDSDASGSLITSEFEAAAAQFLRPDTSDAQFFIQSSDGTSSAGIIRAR